MKPYPQGEDRSFKKAWCQSGRKAHTERPTILMFPNGYLCGDVDADAKGLFHKLSRKTKRNIRWTETKD
jgi:hypothetical protein